MLRNRGVQGSIHLNVFWAWHQQATSLLMSAEEQQPETEKTDAQLVCRVLDGESDDFAALYRRYAPFVRSLCFDTTQDSSCAQDVSQEVFLRAYSKLSALPNPERFASWLIGITRNVCSEWRRSRSRDKHRYVGRSPAVTDDHASSEQDMSQTDLLRAIAKLPERHRTVLHAHYLQGQAVKVACQSLGLSRAGFYKRLKKALARLASELGTTETRLK